MDVEFCQPEGKTSSAVLRSNEINMETQNKSAQNTKTMRRDRYSKKYWKIYNHQRITANGHCALQKASVYNIML